MNDQDTFLSIKQWSEDDRPREKLLLKGKNALSDAELIAILFSTGNRNETAVDLAKKVLNSINGNLVELSKLNIKDLQKFKGIGEAKAISLLAALELGRRRRESEVYERKIISSSKDVFEFFQSQLSDKAYEEFWILLLNRANKIINKHCISEGGISGTVVDPKKIFKIALENNASSIILCHNHPSGNIKPSEQDISLTKKIKEGGHILDIQVTDHLIACDKSYFSFADEGIL